MLGEIKGRAKEFMMLATTSNRLDATIKLSKIATSYHSLAEYKGTTLQQYFDPLNKTEMT